MNKSSIEDVEERWRDGYYKCFFFMSAWWSEAIFRNRDAKGCLQWCFKVQSSKDRNFQNIWRSHTFHFSFSLCSLYFSIHFLVISSVAPTLTSGLARVADPAPSRDGNAVVAFWGGKFWNLLNFSNLCLELVNVWNLNRPLDVFTWLVLCHFLCWIVC